jgi:hypothetical protein
MVGWQYVWPLVAGHCFEMPTRLTTWLQRDVSSAAVQLCGVDMCVHTPCRTCMGCKEVRKLAKGGADVCWPVCWFVCFQGRGCQHDHPHRLCVLGSTITCTCHHHGICMHKPGLACQRRHMPRGHLPWWRTAAPRLLHSISAGTSCLHLVTIVCRKLCGAFCHACHPPAVPAARRILHLTVLVLLIECMFTLHIQLAAQLSY